MLRGLIKKHFKRKESTKKPIYAEDVIYNANGTYILYSIVQNNFHYCMQNRLLKRGDILEFKHMLNGFVNQSDYRYEKFQNDAHEIYRKLKSKSISAQNMLKLNEFLQQFLTVEASQLNEEPLKKYGNLIVVK